MTINDHMLDKYLTVIQSQGVVISWASLHSQELPTRVEVCSETYGSDLPSFSNYRRFVYTNEKQVRAAVYLA